MKCHDIYIYTYSSDLIYLQILSIYSNMMHCTTISPIARIETTTFVLFINFCMILSKPPLAIPRLHQVAAVLCLFGDQESSLWVNSAERELTLGSSWCSWKIAPKNPKETHFGWTHFPRNHDYLGCADRDEQS